MNAKIFTTYEQQINLLKSRGVIINTVNDKVYAEEILQKIGYYNLINGYKKPFLDNSAAETQELSEFYKPNTTIQEIHALYEFDRVLREAFMNFILKVETHIKSLISYYFSEAYGYDNYLRYTNFDTNGKDAHNQIPPLLAEIQRQLAAHTKDPCISHYLNSYGYIPLWVLNGILTFGTVSKFYSLMKISEKTKVSKKFKLQPHDLENFLMYLSSVRNFCAHGNRLFCYESKKKSLNDTNCHKKLNIPRCDNTYTLGKRDLFAALIALNFLLSNNDFTRLKKKISKNITRLSKKLNVLKTNEVLQYMGFPSNWQSL